MNHPLLISIVMPCLNEDRTLEICIKKAESFLKEANVLGEIIIADNGSSDNSIEIAKRNAIELIHVEKKGHGHALYAGFERARGKYVIFGDADNSYDFSTLSSFLEKLDEGYDLIIGNRFWGGIEKGAMPFTHRYFGVPMLSWLNRFLFKNKVYDIHGGLRGFNKASFDKLTLTNMDMTFCTEMVIKASLMGLRIIEVPIVLSPQAEGRKSHLKTWKDGWSCLKCTLLLWRERSKWKQ